LYNQLILFFSSLYKLKRNGVFISFSDGKIYYNQELILIIQKTKVNCRITKNHWFLWNKNSI